MIGLIIIVVCFIVIFSLLILKLSVSIMFWISKNPKDKAQVFKIYFPYYIITVFGFCVFGVSTFGINLFSMPFFGGVFCTTLLFWRAELKPDSKLEIEPQFNLNATNNDV